MLSIDDIYRLTSHGPTFVYPWGCDPNAGFGANHSGLTKSLTLCLIKGLGFSLVNPRESKGIVLSRGYEDYFQPFCGTTHGFLLNRINKDPLPFQKKMPWVKNLAEAYLRSACQPGASHFLFSDLKKLPAADRQHDDQPKLPSDYAELRQMLSKALWAYQPEIAERVETIKAEIPKFSKPYLSLCIRRGDKIIESDYAPLELYAKHLQTYENQFQEVFIAGDDLPAIEELASRLTNFKCLYLSPAFKRGYNNAIFSQQSIDIRKDAMTRFFAQVELMRDSAIFIGTKTTNVSWLVSNYRGGKQVIWID